VEIQVDMRKDLREFAQLLHVLRAYQEPHDMRLEEGKLDLSNDELTIDSMASLESAHESRS
jgi:hypothetical protein